MSRREFFSTGLSLAGSLASRRVLATSVSSGLETDKNQQQSSRKGIETVPPEIFLTHTAEREFIGPAVLEVRKGELWLIAPWGRPPVDFRQVKRFALPPYVYRSFDGGRTWQKGGRLNMRWDLPGIISDGGITLLRLRSGRLMATFHRNVYEYHGGGVPAVSFSDDEGRSWSPARRVQEQEEVFYLMNERTIQLSSGRIVIPVALRPGNTPLGKYVEGNVCRAGCFLSDDDGKTWTLSETVTLADKRGMQEPAVAELRHGGILMLARTGSGSHYACFSRDRGQSWTEPKSTTLAAACSPLTLKRMPNSHLFLAYNPARPLFEGSFFPRRPLGYSISRDEGKTWSAPVVIDDVSGQQLIYPSITFLKESILVVYSAHFDPGDGKFHDDPEAYKVGGGKRCVLPYPT